MCNKNLPSRSKY